MKPTVCQSITRKSASNLALAFILLPKNKRRGMSALYAFCREIDDIADDDGISTEERRGLLQDWRLDIQAACGEGKPRFPVNQELQPVILRHRLPYELFDELLQGVEMDLDIHRYPTCEELDQYCYRVASVVGLLSIEIFGYSHPGCRQYAVHLGKALQLTNILRDVRVDALRGRIYLPLSELARFGVCPEEILNLQYTPRFVELAGSVDGMARSYYRRARESLPPEDRRSMASAELMGSVYWHLLETLKKRRYNVFEETPTRVSKGKKIFLVLRTWSRIWRGALVPNYGFP